MSGILDGIRVLDLSRNVAGPFASKLFADYGAAVLKVEPPEGDPSRLAGPFPGDEPDSEASGLFLHLNTNKRAVTLDISRSAGQSIVRRLAGDVDIVIEDFAPGQLDEWGIGWETLSEGRTDLVMASITPFGQSGPWRDYRGSEITLQAMGGPMHLNGHAEKEPIKLAGNVAHYHAGASAALAVMLARFRVEMGGEGDHVDLAVYETQNGFRDRRTVYMTGSAYTGVSARRRVPGQQMATGVRPCLDGYVNILGGAKHFEKLLDIIDRPDLKGHPQIAVAPVERDPAFVEEVEASYLGWLMRTPKSEVIATVQEAGILSGAIYTIEDLLKDPHYAQRGFWDEIDHPATGPLTYPGRQLIFSETPRERPRRAPLLGEHNSEVYTDQLGMSEGELASMREQGVI